MGIEAVFVGASLQGPRRSHAKSQAYDAESSGSYYESHDRLCVIQEQKDAMPRCLPTALLCKMHRRDLTERPLVCDLGVLLLVGLLFSQLLALFCNA